MNSQLDPAILNAALSGLETKKQELESHIAAVRALLGRRSPGRPPAATNTLTSESEGRTFKRSPAARRRMAAAQRKRYKELRRQASAAKAESAKKAAPAPPKKRKMSVAGRKRIAEAARKRWALIRKQAETPKKPPAVAKQRAARPAVRAVPTIVRRTVAKKSAPKARKVAASVQAEVAIAAAE